MPKTKARLKAALGAAASAIGVHDVEPGAIQLARPARAEHGDLSSNLALILAKRLARAPRSVAEDLVTALGRQFDSLALSEVATTEIAGPGFINFRLSPVHRAAVVTEAASAGVGVYGRLDLGGGARVQIEFVSANPTGPLHVGNGWWAAYGDALARVFQACGYQVEREYYVNDTGGQIRRLGESVLAKARGTEVAEGGYQGDYVAELAARYEGPLDESAESVLAAGRWAAALILDDIKGSLERISVRYDQWYSQASIEESGAISETISHLAERGLIYEKDGATWLASSGLGDNRDRVLVKSDGDPTYLAGDIAYHRDKFIVRGFDQVVDVFGADHHGHVASLKAGVAALGVDPGRLRIQIGQMVSLVGRIGSVDGSAETVGIIKMSKRAGNIVRLDDLVSDIGPDALRLLSLSASIDQPTTLDLEAIRVQSMENPVYYVQYAFARISSIARVMRERSIERRPLDQVDLTVLDHDRELSLISSIETFTEVLESACLNQAPHKVATWVREVAGHFHGFYHDCPILSLAGQDETLLQARLWLVEAARVALASGLDLLGVSAPESM